MPVWKNQYVEMKYIYIYILVHKTIFVKGFTLEMSD